MSPRGAARTSGEVRSSGRAVRAGAAGGRRTERRPRGCRVGSRGPGPAAGSGLIRKAREPAAAAWPGCSTERQGCSKGARSRIWLGVFDLEFSPAVAGARGSRLQDSRRQAGSRTARARRRTICRIRVPVLWVSEPPGPGHGLFELRSQSRNSGSGSSRDNPLSERENS